MNKPVSQFAARKRLLIIAGLALLLSIFPGGTSLGQDQPGRPVLPAELRGSPARATDSWAVVLTPGSDPNVIASQLGYTNLGRIAHLPNTYLFRINNSGISKQSAQLASTALVRNQHIVQFAQQIARQQVPRDPSDDPLNTGTATFPHQWHLFNIPGYVNLNVTPAWGNGITGAGVQIAIVDDGLQHTHPDLQPNYNAAGSWDFDSGGLGDADPAPFISPTGDCGTSNCHGTSVAGVAAAADNPAPTLPADDDFCGVGVAFGANLSGIRLIAAPSTDQMEADALSYQNGDPTNTSTTNDIYSNSWGPSGNGATLVAPGPLTQAAIQSSIANGRGGLGNIYTWAAGNGRGAYDNINADGYANSRYVIAVGATGTNGHYANYSEPGAAMLVTAPGGDSQGIATTDLMSSGGPPLNGCTNHFSGTSATAPMVAGVAALMLQANPNLTWRDVQHILVNSAVKNDPSDPDWTVNAAGYHIDHNYGFGLVDATAAVTLAQTWTNVGAEINFDSIVLPVNQPIPSAITGGGINQTFTVPDNIRVEHVEVIFSAVHSWRGDIEVNLTSPSGTISQLMNRRPADGPPNQTMGDDGNFDNWKFMTVRDWGENSAGNWTINVVDRYPNSDTGTFINWRIIVYGTLTGPQTPSVTGPADAAAYTTTLPQADVNLTWNNINLLQADHLELQLDTVNPPIQTIPLTTATTSYLATLPLGKYYWRIRAVDISNNSFGYSSIRSFTIATPTNNAPIRNYFTTDTPTLTWNRVVGAIRYEVQVSRNSTFTNLVFPTQTVYPPALLLLVPQSLQPDGFYYWRVRACTGTASSTCGTYSATETMTVDKVP